VTATARRSTPAGSSGGAPGPARLPALLLGVGFGGFLDGIVLHQVLGWHHMVSATDRGDPGTLAGLETNVVADGVFHLGAWAAAALGVLLTVRAWRDGRLAPRSASHLGLALAGWGAFNLVEGIVDHHVLGIHHVRDDLGAPLSWDLGFLAVGALQLVGGWAVHARVERRAAQGTGTGWGGGGPT